MGDVQRVKAGAAGEHVAHAGHAACRETAEFDGSERGVAGEHVAQVFHLGGVETGEIQLRELGAVVEHAGHAGGLAGVPVGDAVDGGQRRVAVEQAGGRGFDQMQGAAGGVETGEAIHVGEHGVELDVAFEQGEVALDLDLDDVIALRIPRNAGLRVGDVRAGAAAEVQDAAAVDIPTDRTAVLSAADTGGAGVRASPAGRGGLSAGASRAYFRLRGC
ncbi:hypothetical protein OZX57_08360 [Bifidobacterium sp. ESL0682]|uniref:hypothetical protein n=1 Tax=Bifidobacterium sp. ESL0682 TaxID=2983212 RepID=UPI0023F6E8A4|nr:hypothetical protein [Bifidobacterium sp. ESL0682]WEV41934.1 hypothetical protein OZX57_08360 [Bifidobacterium sp. ESL0682]